MINSHSTIEKLFKCLRSGLLIIHLKNDGYLSHLRLKARGLPNAVKGVKTLTAPVQFLETVLL